MKPKAIPTLLALGSVLATGCITTKAIVQKDVPLSIVPGTIVLDALVTPVFAVSAAHTLITGEPPSPYRPPPEGPSPWRLIRDDPEVIFREKWHRYVNAPNFRQVLAALQDKDVPFTDDQLRRLYREMPDENSVVLGNPRCSPAFQREVLAKVRSVRWTSDYYVVVELVFNPSAPRDNLATIAADPQRFGKFSEEAKRRLDAGK